MGNDPTHEHKSAHRLAFSHYLRTGERLTNDEWILRYERKFNPYHDAQGRFTSPPGVTVSYGSHPENGDRPNYGKNDGVTRTRSASSTTRQPLPKPSAASNRVTKTPARNATTQSGGPNETFRSSAVRNSTVVQSGPAATDFDLRNRQASLDAFRRWRGAKATPEELADMADIQKRLDSDRARLEDITRRVVDPETVEVLRALPPADTLAATINIARGKGTLRDGISVITSVPFIGPLGKLAKLAIAGRSARELAESAEVIQLGGAYRDIRGIPGHEAHHSLGQAVSPLSEGDGPAIVMLKADHRALVTSKGGLKSRVFRKLQAKYIAKGDFNAAMQMDIAHIRLLFGNKYDDAIAQMLRHSKERGIIK